MPTQPASSGRESRLVDLLAVVRFDGSSELPGIAEEVDL